MFSYLRPHRRTPSNPTSPDLQNPTDNLNAPENPQLRSRRSHGQFSKSPVSSLPPSLPPISRISSPTHEQNTLKELEEEDHGLVEGLKMRWKNPHGAASSRDASPSRSNIKSDWQPKRSMSPGRSQNPKSTETPQHYGNEGQKLSEQSYKAKNYKSSPAVPTVKDLQEWTNNTRRQPIGIRIPTPPPIPDIPVSTFEAAAESGEKRKRLNILNPISLLSRRRTAQAVLQIAPPQPSNNPNAKAPILYDPSIRGTKVHDFSAPRERKHVPQHDLKPQSGHGTSRDPQRGTEIGERPWSGGNHTPVFKEDFEEEQYPAAGPHVRKANDLSDLHVPNPPFARGPTRSTPDQPNEKTENASRNKPVNFNSAEETQPSIPAPQSHVPAVSGNEKKVEVQAPLEFEEKRKSQRTTDSPPKSGKVPSQKRRSRGISDVSAGDVAVLHGLPKHMKSTSSRFSFDMIGAAKQEKILEDRHRQKAAERKAASPSDDEYDDGGQFDDFDYDGMIDDDGLEERIPGVNADLDEEDMEEDNLAPPAGNMAGFTFQTMATTSTVSSPMTPYSPQLLPTPRDASGQIIGFAYSKDSPALGKTYQSELSPGLLDSRIESETSTINEASNNRGLGLADIDFCSQGRHSSTDLSPPASFQAPPIIDDDDLYFDDGIIDAAPEDADATEFDESVFDLNDTDQYGRPLRPFTQSFGPSTLPMNLKASTIDASNLEPIAETSPTTPNGNELIPSPKPDLEINTAAKPSGQSTLSPQMDPVIAPHPSVTETRPQEPEKPQIDKPSTNLTHDSLAAYQSALAAAAFKAAANGRFRRSSTPISERDEGTDHPSLVPDSGRQSEEIFSPSYDAMYDDFNYDDELEDDDIIAAANAEALAYDCDGFYGQEFGFYSAPPSASGSNQYIHGMGGYFGPRGEDGLIRSASGRIAMREPNLTPITERSEYSNRNSIMSMQIPGFERQSMTSPGLAQLAGMMGSYDEETMSIGALMKLRNRAWGGSQASLHSTNSDGSPKSAAGDGERHERQTSSPINQIGQWQQSSGAALNGHVRQNSNLSLASDYESNKGSLKSVHAGSIPTGGTGTIPENEISAGGVDRSAPESPVLMMASLPERKRRRSDVVKSPVSSLGMPNSASSATMKEKENDREGEGVQRPPIHKKTGSADSISYMKEGDGERWVLERRRTAESGEMELLGREVVLGGRI